MRATRNPDARIAAFFETTQPDLPDRTFEAVRNEIHRTRQLVVVGPWREPRSYGGGYVLIAAAAVLALAVVGLNLRPAAVGPGGPTSLPTPTAAPSPTVSPSVKTSPPRPTVFTSELYGYTVTVPAGWTSAAAILRWDGTKQPGPEAETDQFVGPGDMTAWAFAGPFRGDLTAFVADRIAATARDHSDTCPVAEPEINERLQIGRQAWVLLGWDCGALINTAVTVRAGVAYTFNFRDLDLRAATDPDDRAIFLSMLDSVELPT
jgi:hypothetical protein